MTYDLVYTERAKRDLQRATDSIARDAPETAQRWFDGFVATLQTLSVNATVYCLAPESELCAIEVRQMIYRTKSRRVNRALYTIRGTTAYILAIRRPGEDLLTEEELAEAIADLR
jgi:plasmid stabilization system protein ParE